MMPCCFCFRFYTISGRGWFITTVSKTHSALIIWAQLQKNLTQMHVNDRGAYQPLTCSDLSVPALLAGKNNEYTCLNIKFPDSSKYVY